MLARKKVGGGGRNQHGPGTRSTAEHVAAKRPHVAGVTDAAEFETALSREIEAAAVAQHWAEDAAERASVAAAGLMSARSRVIIPVTPAVDFPNKSGRVSAVAIKAIAMRARSNAAIDRVTVAHAARAATGNWA